MAETSTQPETAPSSRPAVAALLLAAGSSRRFGPENKLLAVLGGRPLVSHAATAIAASQVAARLAVLGPDAEAVREALAGLDFRTICNSRHAEGIGTSIAAGASDLLAGGSGTIDGALVVQGDMPGLTGQLIDQLIAVFGENGRDVVVHPVDRAGLQGNPVLWPSRLLPALAALDGDRGAKALIEAERAAGRVVAVLTDDPGAFLDIDTKDALLSRPT